MKKDDRKRRFNICGQICEVVEGKCDGADAREIWGALRTGSREAHGFTPTQEREMNPHTTLPLAETIITVTGVHRNSIHQTNFHIRSSIRPPR